MVNKNWLLFLLQKARFSKLAKVVTKKKLRILCYHGFSTSDEHLWQPGVFMRPEIFEKRLAYLDKNKFPVLELQSALELLQESKLPNYATVITMDDGWVSSKTYGHEICRSFNFPYTMYVSSYHCVKESPVFNMAVRYLFWKTEIQQCDISSVIKEDTPIIDLKVEEQTIHYVKKIISYGSSHLTDHERTSLLSLLAQILDVDFDSIIASRMLNLLTRNELRKLVEDGVNLELHTHRHTLPSSEAEMKNELIENREFLESIVGHTPNHFCYPSGYFESHHEKWLEELNILSGTTTRPGFNSRETHPLFLNRFLDSDNYSELLFDAELSGTLELARNTRTFFD